LHFTSEIKKNIKITDRKKNRKAHQHNTKRAENTPTKYKEGQKTTQTQYKKVQKNTQT
jgi:hypothetical protein